MGYCSEKLKEDMRKILIYFQSFVYAWNSIGGESSYEWDEWDIFGGSGDSIEYTEEIEFPNVVLDNTAEYHHTEFYAQKLKFTKMHNGKPMFENYSFLYGDKSYVIELKWIKVHGDWAWAVLGDYGVQEDPINKKEGTLRFVSRSDVFHPKDATEWIYTPYKIETTPENYVQAPMFRVAAGTQSLDSSVHWFCADEGEYHFGHNSPLRCDVGEIKVIRATLTRKSAMVCESIGASYYSQSGLCGEGGSQERDVTEEIGNRCDGESVCETKATLFSAGEVCDSVDKYTIVTYRCETAAARECNPDSTNWRKKLPNGEQLTCDTYRANNWCTMNGEKGDGLDEMPFYYEIDAEKRENEYSAFNCPECGCQTADMMYEESEEILGDLVGEMIGEMIGEEILEDMVEERPPTAGSNVVHVCEHPNTAENDLERGNLKCGKKEKIEVISAIYGRPFTDYGDLRNMANKCRANGQSSTNGQLMCTAQKDLTSFAKSACDGKDSCKFHGGNGMSGDPCTGVNKYTTVEYNCHKLRKPVKMGKQVKDEEGWNSKALMITSIVLAIGLLLLIIDFALLCCGKCGVTYNIINCSGYDPDHFRFSRFYDTPEDRVQDEKPVEA